MRNSLIPEQDCSILLNNLSKSSIQSPLFFCLIVDSMWNLPSTVRIGLALTLELMDQFQTEPLAVLELLHLESGSRTEPNQKVLV